MPFKSALRCQLIPARWMLLSQPLSIPDSCDEIMQEALMADQDREGEVPGYPGLTQLFHTQVHSPTSSQPPVIQFQVSTKPNLDSAGLID